MSKPRLYTKVTLPKNFSLTKQEQYLKDFEELTARMLEITSAKNQDYTGDSSQPFKNFTMVETIGFSTTEQGFTTRIVDKVMRIAGFVKNGTLQVKDESVEDTLLDMANYCLLFICYLRSKKNKI